MDAFENNNSTTPCSVSTFHNLSLYWSPYEGNRSGNFKLDSNSVGIDRGECVPNIIRNNSIGKVDIGAQNSNVSHMYFGANYNFTVPSVFEQCLN